MNCAGSRAAWSKPDPRAGRSLSVRMPRLWPMDLRLDDIAGLLTRDWHAHIFLGVFVGSPAGFNAAVEGGADRIELCSSLSVGGLTPSRGFMAFAAKGTRPSRAMIRPRVGSYVFSEDEIDVMRRDIDAAREAGLAGVVIGANLASGQLDEKTTARLAQHASGLELTLHRSVDL